MAEARVSVDLDQFNCSICLDLLKDPVSVNCGHSFCMNCIKTKWDQDDVRGVYSCPLCRKNFPSRPVLGRNTVLAEMVERLKKVHVSDATLAGPEDVECDVCVERKHKAEKTCLTCLASYCGSHFRLHQELNPGNKHKVTKASARLKERVCRYHNKPKEVYCETDQMLVCHECAMFGCKEHKTSPIRYERSGRQGKIDEIQVHIHQRMLETEKELQKLRTTKQSIKSSAKILLDQNEKTFMKLIRAAESKRSHIREIIRDAEEAGLHRTEEIKKHLEMETARLERRDDELQQLCRIEDDFLFIETSKSLFDLPTLENTPKTSTSLYNFQSLQNTVSEITREVDAFCYSELDKNSTPEIQVPVVQTSFPVLREDFLQYSRQLTVDASTIHRNLLLSEGKRKLTYCKKPQNYPGDKRFQDHSQGLCGQVTGRCYWEVEWGGTEVFIGATYMHEMMFLSSCPVYGLGHNAFSWSLCCTPSKCSFFHNNKENVITEAVPSRVGVYLDKEAGVLAFYCVTDIMTLLHRVQTTFTEPVYPGFWVFEDSHVMICEHNKQSRKVKVTNPMMLHLLRKKKVNTPKN